MAWRKSDDAEREFALELMELGSSALGAARRMGRNGMTVWGWAKVAGMELKRGGRGPRGALPPVLPVEGEGGLRGHGHGNRLNTHDRVVIHAGLGLGWSQARIAEHLGGRTLDHKSGDLAQRFRGQVFLPSGSSFNFGTFVAP